MHDDIRIEAGSQLSEKSLLSSIELINSVWPDYVGLFRGEMDTYRSAPEVFNPYYVTAAKDEKSIGFAILLASVMSVDLLAISWVCVHPEFRGHKIGEALVSSCLKEAERQKKSVVLTTDIPEFYTRQGFDMIDEYADKKYICKYALPEGNE